jgi:hypothetical protein
VDELTAMNRKGNEARYRFILQALDPVLRGPAIEALFYVEALDDIRVLLGPQAAGDSELDQLYYPTGDQLRAITGRFDVAFDPGGRVTRLHNLEIRGRLPYLFHSGYELAMLLDGTKQFGYADHHYPPHQHEEEDLFDRYVAQGVLHKEVIVESWNPPIRRKDGSIWEGYRRVYYTRKAEEWRIPAWRLLWEAAEKHPWNEGFERLSSMLFGYEAWQTDYWLAFNRERRGFWGGMPIYCAVTGSELSWIEAAGYRAFPPVGLQLTFTLSDDRPTGEALHRLLNGEAVGLVRANISGSLIRHILKEQPGPTYAIPAAQLPELNRSIVGTIDLIDHHNQVRS